MRKNVWIDAYKHHLKGIALASPDLPGLIGWLDEGLDSVLFGWAVYSAVGE